MAHNVVYEYKVVDFEGEATLPNDWVNNANLTALAVDGWEVLSASIFPGNAPNDTYSGRVLFRRVI